MRILLILRHTFVCAYFHFAKIQLFSDITTNRPQKSQLPNAAVHRSSGLDSDEKQGLRRGGYAAMVGGAPAYNPEYAVGSIDEEKLALFVNERVFMVGEEVADKLRATGHAQRLEPVGSAPVAQGEWQHDSVGIEEHLIGREAARVGTGLRGGEPLDMNAGQLPGGRCLEGGNEEHIPVEQRGVGGREESSARHFGGEDIGHCRGIEAVGTQQFVKKLGIEGATPGDGGHDRSEVKAEAERCVGQAGEELLAERGKQGLIELLCCLKVGNGAG